MQLASPVAHSWGRYKATAPLSVSFSLPSSRPPRRSRAAVTGSGGASPASLPSSPRAPRWARPVHARPSRLRRLGRRSRVDADLGGGAGLASASPLARLFQAGVRARGWWPCGRVVSTSSLPSSSALLAGGGSAWGASAWWSLSARRQAAATGGGASSGVPARRQETASSELRRARVPLFLPRPPP
jgi:hypothetical protein